MDNSNVKLKDVYINNFLKLLDNSYNSWLYRMMLPNFDELKEENPEEYTNQMILFNQGYYSVENVKKRFKQVLMKEKLFTISDLYNTSVRYDKYLMLKLWLNKTVRIIPTNR